MKKNLAKLHLGAGQILLTMPSFGWLMLFFILPTAMVLLVTFHPALPGGGVGKSWTLSTWRNIANPHYPEIIWRTVWMSIVSTAICIAISVPAAFAFARARSGMRHLVSALVVLPFWTSFLIRVFAWKTLLHPEGILASAINSTGLFAEPVNLLYNPGTVLLVMVYTYLPFAMLPLFAAAEKFDFSLMEASLDLGAGQLRSFFSTFVPGIRAGIMSAMLMVFIPALGSYVIPDMVGGKNNEMIGTKIAQRATSDRNLPQAGVLSMLLMFGVLVPPFLAWALSRSRAAATGAGDGGTGANGQPIAAAATATAGAAQSHAAKGGAA